jgi:hypothetical protein
MKSPIDAHTPEELLATAEWLLASDNPNGYRAAVLEAITALETYVRELIVVRLRVKVGDDLAGWLEQKTKMDFDARMSVLVPVATGLKVDLTSPLWNRYKIARDIRNKVVHAGAKATKASARSVISTVYEWLDYLKSMEQVVGQIDDEAVYKLAGRFLEASARLERVIYTTSVNAGKDPSRRRTMDIHELSGMIRIPPQLLRELDGFRELRNHIAHGTRRDFADLNQKKIDRLNEIVALLKSALAAK